MGGIPLPGELGERARDILAGRVEPVPARDAATVVILREGRESAEVYMLRRKASMAFAAGAYVFPGGSVDPRDTDQAVAWAGPSPAAWGEVFRADDRTARGLVCAAVRETFEESGVLLAGLSEDSVVADTTGDEWESDRLALIDRSLSFADFLDRRGLVLRSDLLRPWAHWITPRVEHRRFDTRFFVAALPPGQRTRDVGGEADQVAWVRPADAIDRARSGQIFLMPPTYRTLGELRAYEKVPDVLAVEREIVTLMPEIAEVDGEMHIVLDDDYRFGAA
ncbi:NUDIX hydrolase [Streptosporangium lutulentum]|uniref:8-oxo-dGTP pyrophosphatase MutT (NUDIX family) n=1 Tax=Streptosporangium lutulentum TaxID=1461250 RepID=A0ABT9QKY7_9ACTN|nr:NUDIX hydrolase [Streptosporangium lutulentum]MDP9847394.1 8-oxo-dGTP pyrophosphatase MutT (NUDIX family) [Streptosporangium lutulentum]